MIINRSQAYQINSNNQEVIINLKRTLIDAEKLEQFLDYLTIKSIQQNSQLSQDNANQLIDKINTVVWQKQKSLFEL
jgi:predicted SnoaL-like aldol condensation-catalyzing enzyme